MMKATSPVSLSLVDPIVVDANINELERRIRELCARVQVLEAAEGPNFNKADDDLWELPEVRIAQARREERERAVAWFKLWQNDPNMTWITVLGHLRDGDEVPK